jgi:transcriptional regulator with XRE-family HTH domain
MFYILSIDNFYIFEMRFGDRFRALLRGRGLTQVAAANLLEMQQATVSYYCRLDRPPRPHILSHMADRLGVTAAELKGEKKPAGVKTDASSKAPNTPIPVPDQSVYVALNDLKSRWKKKPRERVTIRHLIAALFPVHHAKVLTWLEQD